MILSQFQKNMPNATTMEELGAQLAQGCLTQAPTGLIIYLNGPLGAGKTTLVRGFLRGMHYDGIVKSPTYTLVETYEFPLAKVNHFDLYRINAAEELEYIGIRDYFSQAYCLVEWPEKAKDILPVGDLNIFITIYPQQMISRVGAERLNRRSVYKIHDCGEMREGNNPEKSAAKGITSRHVNIQAHTERGKDVLQMLLS